MDKKTAQKKVRVVVRSRPVLKPDAKTCVTVTENKVQIVNHKNKDESLQYEFSSVYDEKTTQQAIFSDCVEPLLSNTLQGQNVSIFAYGPTGAGKTHTMLGVMSDPGIIPRVIRSLFRRIQEEKDAARDKNEEQSETTVMFSYMEIYNEKVQDLLQSGNHDLPIREDASHNIFVAGLTEKMIDSFDTFKGYFHPASSNRTVAATKLNENSSRSHSILLLKVHRRWKTKQYQGKIYLIDLAGSEDNRRTGNRGIRLKESGAINKSLFVLGEVVDAINHNLPRVPYRNSKLTRLLQDSIGGSCHSVMITNIAPEYHYYYDTYCTLNFATKSKKIVNTTTTNIKQESPPVKPVAAVKPMKRRSSPTPVADNKRRRTSLSTSDLQSSTSTLSNSNTTLKESQAVPLPSPLVRQHQEFKAAVQKKLQDMEKVLQNLQKSTVDSVAMPSTQLSNVQSSQFTPTCSKSDKHKFRCSTSAMSASPDIICPTPELSIGHSKLADTTNLLSHRHLHLMGTGKKSQKLKLKKAAKPNVDDPSCSILFPNSPTPKKKTRRSSESTPIKKKTEKAAKKFHNPEQFQRNADFLNVLNTASVKELQQLQTVGIKRAKAIHDWRELHGPFDFIDALKEIPGFTDKYLKNLLRSNLVTHSQNIEC